MATRQRICRIRVLAKNLPFLSNLSTRQKFAIFGKFEYSPKWPFSEMCRTRQTRRHSPSRVARTRQTRRHSLSRVARTRQTRQHALWRVFEKNVTRLDTFARVTCESREFGASGHCLHQGNDLKDFRLG